MSLLPKSPLKARSSWLSLKRKKCALQVARLSTPGLLNVHSQREASSPAFSFLSSPYSMLSSRNCLSLIIPSWTIGIIISTTQYECVKYIADMCRHRNIVISMWNAPMAPCVQTLGSSWWWWLGDYGPFIGYSLLEEVGQFMVNLKVLPHNPTSCPFRTEKHIST